MGGTQMFPANKEQNEPIKEIIGEDKYETDSSNVTSFEELYATAGESCTPVVDYFGLQHVAGDIDNIQSASVVMYEREFFYADVALDDVETIDVATGQKFNMIAMVLWTINNFPARSTLSGWSGQGYKACPTCNKDTLSVRVLGKTAYVGHIRFLKKPHKWRRSLEFNGETEDGDPPREFNQD
ncbi:reverse transcriptase domain-containing protein [Tanacetum coccineum]